MGFVNDWMASGKKILPGYLQYCGRYYVVGLAGTRFTFVTVM